MILYNIFSEYYNEGVAVYVQPPSKRTIIFDSSYSDGESWPCSDYDYCDCEACKLEKMASKRNSFYLSMPYVAFQLRYVYFKKRFSFRSLQVALSTDKDLKNLFILPLPNISDTQVCMGSSVVGSPKLKCSTKTLTECFNNIINGFWSSRFNSEIVDNIDFGSKKTLHSLARWHNKTASYPNWVPSRAIMDKLNNDDYLEFHPLKNAAYQRYVNRNQ